jgi:hypothetical protein
MALKRLSSLLSLMILFVSGCAVNKKIAYPVADIAPISSDRFSSSVVMVKPLVDERHPVAKAGETTRPAMVKRDDSNWWFYNSDDHYRSEPVAAQVTRMLIEHLNASHLFQNARPYDDNARSEAQWMLEGRITTFDAYKQRSMATQVGAQFGLIGALFTSGVQSEFEATTVLSNMKLTNTATNEVIWEGAARSTIRGMDSADPYGWAVYAVANASLKQAIDNLLVTLKGLEGRAHDESASP